MITGSQVALEPGSVYIECWVTSCVWGPKKLVKYMQVTSISISALPDLTIDACTSDV